MHFRIEIDEVELRALIFARLRDMLGEIGVDSTRIVIEVKSKQNYRSMWEQAAFRAIYEIGQPSKGETSQKQHHADPGIRERGTDDLLPGTPRATIDVGLRSAGDMIGPLPDLQVRRNVLTTWTE